MSWFLETILKVYAFLISKSYYFHSHSDYWRKMWRCFLSTLFKSQNVLFLICLIRKRKKKTTDILWSIWILIVYDTIHFTLWVFETNFVTRQLYCYFVLFVHDMLSAFHWDHFLSSYHKPHLRVNISSQYPLDKSIFLKFPFHVFFKNSFTVS